MTVNGDTICSLIQTFPVLLILSQNYNKCLKTPLIYKPPTPTPSPEYYEALDALFQSLYGHGCQGNQHGYGKKHYDHSHYQSYGNPCYYYSYPSTSHGYGYNEHEHGYAYPTYSFKKGNMYNLSGTNHGYAPNQVTSHHRYKVVVKKTKIGNRRRAEKLQTQAENCQTIDGQIGGCKSIYYCPEYLQLLKDARTNPAAVQQLRRVHCGFDGNAPKVCCPKPGFTPPPFPEPITTTTTTTTPAPATASPKTSDDFTTVFPEPPVCGYSNASLSRVVGGIPAKLGDFPWMALLGYRTKRSPIEWLCGGSLITSRHILTATHCIHKHEDQLYVVRLGELDLAREDDGAHPVDYLIKKQIVHKQYSPTAYTNDIALLLLEREVMFTDMIKPICIPRESELRARSFENYNPIIAGWGNTEFRGVSATHLQVLQLPVLATDFCVKAYAKYKNQVIDGRNICAGYKNGGKDACQGDSGGPLMQPIYYSETNSYHFYQIGVISYGKGCAEAGFPGIYSRVTEFIPWIEENVLGSV